MRARKRLPLLFLRQVQKKLDDARAVAVQVALEIADRAIAVFPYPPDR